MFTPLNYIVDALMDFKYILSLFEIFHFTARRGIISLNHHHFSFHLNYPSHHTNDDVGGKNIL